MSKRKPTTEYRMPDFTNRLRELFSKSGMTVGEFANSVGVTRQAMNSYLNEGRIPDCETLQKICSSQKISADYLLGLAKAKSPDPDLKVACDYTGLSEDALVTIHDFNSLSSTFGKSLVYGLNYILTNDFNSLCTMLTQITNAQTARKRLKKMDGTAKATDQNEDGTITIDIPTDKFIDNGIRLLLAPHNVPTHFFRLAEDAFHDLITADNPIHGYVVMTKDVDGNNKIIEKEFDPDA